MSDLSDPFEPDQSGQSGQICPRPARSLGRGRVALALAGALVAGAALVPSVGAEAAPVPADGPAVTWGDTPGGLGDLDVRGRALPARAQKRAAAALGAVVRWNDFGTPASILPRSGDLGSVGKAAPVRAARTWLTKNRVLLGLTRAQVRSLHLVNNQRLAGSRARAVLFEQRFGGLAPALGSKVTVGIANGRVEYVSSSLTRTTGRPAVPVLSPIQGWLTAAANVGRQVSPEDVLESLRSAGWTRLDVDGFAQPQLVRLRALALADGSVRPVLESNVVDVAGGSALAYTLLVDAATGSVLHRQNQVEHSSDAFPVQGEITATTCGPKHPVDVTDANTRQIVFAATALVASNDITLKLFDPAGALLVSQDLATSPEALTYTASSIPAGVYSVQVCPFDSPDVPFVAPGAYAGAVLTSDVAGPTAAAAMPYPPKWRYFAANPALDYSTATVAGNRVTGCWVTSHDGRRVAGCDTPPGALANLGAKQPWDVNPLTGLPTFSTIGNAAVTHEAWANPLAPGGLLQAPLSVTREYTAEFTDAWQNSRCDPANLLPGGNDIEASVTNLFVSHNRMHDFAYYLGFTEANYNLQQSNFGLNPDPTRAGDPELGQAQAGALTGGQPTLLGRDNANQIALQDGIPGITNQYLFQPIAGAFYSPCADGGLDMSIVGHEYTHAISNRMVGGPDEGLTSAQGGAMGESWSDLVAQEYLFEHGLSNGANPWAVGPYATGNRQRGIRDYAVNHNPLQYGDYGFDTPGPEVHADGEIWNGVQWDVRQALVRKWDSRFRYGNRRLQLRCADGTETTAPLPSTRCPGNRRWLQLMFDSFLLQQGATSMLDARDAMLAADRMRYHGANQAELWLAFARNGMGADARSRTADDDQPTPGYVSPLTRSAKVTFRLPAKGRVYLGRYEARATPAADTVRGTPLDATVRLSPGRYDVLAAAPGHGLQRFRLKVRSGQRVTKRLPMAVNLASAKAGARIVATSPGSLNPGFLIDDTEATNWAGVNAEQSVDTAHPFLVVNLAGGRHRLRSARVSALLRPAPPGPTDGLPLFRNADEDPSSGARFTALRRFALDVCVQTARNRCAEPEAKWRRVFVSGPDAFPGGRPRPTAPDLTLRTFTFPAAPATHVRFVALENQCTGYAGYAGEQDNDPLNDTDCKSATDLDLSVRAAELELFG